MPKNRSQSKGTGGSQVNNLVEQVYKLSSQERAVFFKRVGGLDLIRYLGAEVRIDDWQGADRKWPRATILYQDESEESIDIIRSVRENAISIGHPAILHAIRRWQYIALYEEAFSGGGQYMTSQVDFPKIARAHLDNIGKALQGGAKSRAVPKEFALYIMRALGTDMDYTYLQMAWEMLLLDEVKWKQFGEGVRKERSNEDKRRVIKRNLIMSTAGRINLQWSALLRLQTSLAQEYRLEAKLKYANLDPEVKLKDPSGNVMPIHRDSFMNSSSDFSMFEAWVKPPEGPLRWVKLSELIHLGASRLKSENGSYKIGDIIKAADYRLPRQGLTNRERKLAAIMGLMEFVPSPSKGSGGKASRYTKVYERRPISLDSPFELLKKRKLDLVIDFLKSETGEKYLKRRPSWAAFRSAFDAWRFGYNKNAMRKYRSQARKLEEMKYKIEGKSWLGLDGRFGPPPWLDGQFLLPDFINEYACKEISDWFSLPTVAANKRK